MFRRIVGLVVRILDSKYGHFGDERSACCVQMIEFRAVIDVGIVVVSKYEMPKSSSKDIATRGLLCTPSEPSDP